MSIAHGLVSKDEQPANDNETEIQEKLILSSIDDHSKHQMNCLFKHFLEYDEKILKPFFIYEYKNRKQKVKKQEEELRENMQADLNMSYQRYSIKNKLDDSKIARQLSFVLRDSDDSNDEVVVETPAVQQLNTSVQHETIHKFADRESEISQNKASKSSILINADLEENVQGESKPKE